MQLKNLKSLLKDKNNVVILDQVKGESNVKD